MNETRTVVAECWTCGGYHTTEDERAGIRRPMPNVDAQEHRTAGHDVREVTR